MIPILMYSSDTTMKKTRTYLSTLSVLALAILISACGRDRNNPGIQYAPEMYESIPYEPFKQVRDSITPLRDGQTLQYPPEGTIARGKWASYEFPNSEVDSVRHSEGVKNFYNPLRRTDENMASAKVLYTRFCGTCHGAKGTGNGSVAKHPAINPAAYNAGALAAYTQGEVYYVIMHGKGVMGSYASQLEYEDRLKVCHYIEGLQGYEMAPEYNAFADAKFYEMVEDEVTGEEKIKLLLKKGDAFWVEGVEYMGAESGGYELNGEGRGQAEMLADLLKKFPDLNVAIYTHTYNDSLGQNDAAAMAITEKQAEAFVAEVTSTGLPESRVIAMPMGAQAPVNRNLTEDHMQRNVRTEIHILDTTKEDKMARMAKEAEEKKAEDEAAEEDVEAEEEGEE